MSVNRISQTASATLLAGAFILFASASSPLQAQTANNVVCAGCVGSSDIANGSITSADVAPNSIGGGNIVDGSIYGNDLANGSISGVKVANGTIRNQDLHPEAKGGGGDFHEASNATFGLSIIPLTSADTTVRYAYMTLPAAGVVIVNASGFFDHSGGARSTGRCELTTASTIDVLYGKTVLYADGESGDENTIALTRGFNVAGPGTVLYRLVCDRYSGPGDLDIINPSLTAIYVPQRF